MTKEILPVIGVATRQGVYDALDIERTYQDSVWPMPAHLHSVTEFLVYMEDYISEAKHILSRETEPDCDLKALHIIRKVTAMGVAAMEQHGAPIRELTISKEKK